MSSPKRARLDDGADNDQKENTKRVLVYRNGNDKEWKVFKVPTSLETLLENIGVKFGLQAKAAFHKQGIRDKKRRRVEASL
ncbi:hypothetical protein MRX96_021819 [Rhipicephalus microplus]